ncbi:MAG: hypothetical protein AMXMBFR58_29510 [Phycisphaerae bacterium]
MFTSYRNGQVINATLPGDAGDAINGTLKGLLQRVGLVSVLLSAFAGGAVGDGVADDTAALQAASDAVTTGGEIFVPKGTYLFTSLKMYAGQKWRCEEGAKFVWKNNGTSGAATGVAITLDADVPSGTPCYAAIYANQTGGPHDDIWIEHLELDCQGATQKDNTSFAGICTDNITNVHLTACRVYDCKPTVNHAGGHRAWTVLLHGFTRAHLHHNWFNNGGYDCVALRGTGASILVHTDNYYGDATFGSLQAAFGVSEIYGSNNEYRNTKNATTAHGFYNHGTSYICETGSKMYSQYGCAVNGFGDFGPDGSAATTETQLLDYTRDDFFSQFHCFVNCDMRSDSDQGVFWYNGRYVRNINVLGGRIIKTGSAGVAIKLIGEILTTGSPDVHLCGRYVTFDGVDVNQLTSSDLATISHFKDVIVRDCNVRKTGSNHGWALTGVTRFLIDGGASMGPGGDCRFLRLFRVNQDSLTVGCTQISIRNHRLLTNGSGAATWSYIFDCDSASSHGLFLMDNVDVRGAGAGSNHIFNTCTPDLTLGPCSFRNLIGVEGAAEPKRRGRTRLKGTATIPNGATSVVVTHYLAKCRPIVPADIRLNFAESPGAAKAVWVSAVDNAATDPTFTISCDTNPGADTDVSYDISIEA